LSQNLCNLMGGEITVESVLGKGSCFTIRLPAIARPMAPEMAEDAGDAKARGGKDAGGIPAAEAGNGKRVLIVDDDIAFLELAERLFAKEGYDAVSTNEPKGVLQLARTIKPDLVLLDVLMPECDGWTVLKA